MSRYLILLSLALTLFACQTTPKGEIIETTAAGEAKILSFGEKIDQNNVVAYDDFLAQFEGKEKVATKVKGKVEGVCQAKGCWMNIVSKDANKPSMFVKFKDYGFFMPKDIAGKEVIMEGYAFKETTSVDELRHYAEDEGKSKAEIEAITEPKEELKFMASGVLLLN